MTPAPANTPVALLARAVLCLLFAGGSCARKPSPPPLPARPARKLDPPRPELMPGVVAPRFLPAAQNPSVREQAIESIGTYEWQDWTTPGSPLVNTNGHYWTRLADLAWNRDIEIHLDNVPVDLDQDGTVDTHVTRHISLKGGIFANPEVFGLAADPDQPAGARGYTSASTGFSGLRDALDLETGKPTGDIGMTCWLCHSGRNPVDGKTILGLPSARLDYGLLLATSSFLDPKHVIDLDKDGQPDSEEEIRRRTRLPDSLALDLDHDGRVTVAEYRKALKLPDAQQTLATLLLAGPGRADLTNEFGLDMTVPGLHSRRYSDAGTMRTGAEGVFNPKSIPTALGVRSLSVINWASTYPTRAPDLLGRYVARTEMSRSQAMAELGIDLPAGFEGDFDLINRAMVLDTRSMGAIGLQADSFVGIMLVRVLRHDSPAPPDLVRSLRLAYEASAIRKLLYDTPPSSVTKPVLDAAAVQRGRRLFFDASAGSIINQQILVDVPRAYRDSEIQPPLLAPIDEMQPFTARIPVRCVTCHSATTLSTKQPIPTEGLAIPRCTDCHFSHQPTGLFAKLGLRKGEGPGGFTSIFDEFGIARTSGAAKDEPCRHCHDQHPALAEPVTYTSCLILPFDADGDGRAQGDERDDLAAGGIGTDSLFGFEVDRRKLADKNVRMPITRITALSSRGPVQAVQIAGPWVRTPPLITLLASSPYLHNGSVPTLEALLQPSDERPASFVLGQGQGAFTFDTRLPGNRNLGHEFGTHWSAQDKHDLLQFLKSL
ncbi:MAG: hypothetical protein ABSF35_15935 [Polyangia bacterium]